MSTTNPVPVTISISTPHDPAGCEDCATHVRQALESVINRSLGGGQVYQTSTGAPKVSQPSTYTDFGGSREHGYKVSKAPSPDVVTAIPESPRGRVLREAVEAVKARGEYEEGDETLMGLDCNRQMNAGIEGRPSDHARTVAREYKADPARYRARAAAETRRVTSEANATARLGTLGPLVP